jgi:hypothetical protein
VIDQGTAATQYPVGPREGETLEYTDQQRSAFKDAYAKRLRKQLIMIVLLFAVMAALRFTEEGDTFFGLSQAVFGSISLVAIVVGSVIFNSRNWRCPACDKYLGRAFNPIALPLMRHITAWMVGGARPNKPLKLSAAGFIHAGRHARNRAR